MPASAFPPAQAIAARPRDTIRGRQTTAGPPPGQGFHRGGLACRLGIGVRSPSGDRPLAHPAGRPAGAWPPSTAIPPGRGRRQGACGGLVHRLWSNPKLKGCRANQVAERSTQKLWPRWPCFHRPNLASLPAATRPWKSSMRSRPPAGRRGRCETRTAPRQGRQSSVRPPRGTFCVDTISRSCWPHQSRWLGPTPR